MLFQSRHGAKTDGQMDFLKSGRERERCVKEAVVEQGLFKNYDIKKVQSLNTPLLYMDATSLNYWLTTFVQEVAKRSKERYPPRTVYGIIAGIRRFIEEKKLEANFNLLNVNDDR